MWTERKLRNQTGKILKLLGSKAPHGAALDVFLLPHAEMKALKARFFKKQTEPNVLSFREPAQFPHPRRETKRVAEKKYLGEIYLNRDILAKSPERAVPLLTHGILHLLGYDHKRQADAAAMEGLERMLAASLL